MEIDAIWDLTGWFRAEGIIPHQRTLIGRSQAALEVLADRR